MKIRVYLALCVGASLGFAAGLNADAYNRRSLEIENQCAHYDTHSGDFTWGPAPLAINMPLVTAPAATPSVPKHKPAVGK